MDNLPPHMLTPNLFGNTLPTREPSADNITWHFADVAEAARHAAKADRSTMWHDTAFTNSDNFSGGSMTLAHNLAAEGWEDGAKAARALSAQVEAERPIARALNRYSVAGATPSIPRALAGNPLNMRTIGPKESQRGPILSLSYNMAQSCAVKAKTLQHHASAAAAVVDMLEDRGHRCDVTTIWQSKAPGTRQTTTLAVQCKAAPDALNLAALTYGIGHAAFFRRIMFAIVGMERRASFLTGCLGYPVAMKPDPAEGKYVLPGPEQTQAHTGLAAFDAMIASLRAQGCPGIPEA